MTEIDGKMESDGKTEHADKAKLIEQPESIEKTDGQSDVVTLSPSAVDSLWACPVCWMLENRFAAHAWAARPPASARSSTPSRNRPPKPASTCPKTTPR